MTPVGPCGYQCSRMTEGFKHTSFRRPDGVELHAIEAGKGPTVLLAHGYLLDHTLYADLVPKLVGRGFRVVAFDQRGHGRSGCRPGDGPEVMAADYADLIQRCSGDQTILVGHSMGGFLALLTFLQERELCARSLRRLVLLGGNAGKVAEGSLANRLQIPLLQSGLLPPLWRVRPVGQALMGALFGEDRDPVLVERTRKMVVANDPRATLSVLRAMTQRDLYPQLGEVSVETRVVCGKQDQTCPPWHSERLAAEIPGAHATWVPGCGHMLPFEAPDAVLEAIGHPD